MNKIANVRSVAAPTVEELVARTRELKPLLSKNGPLGESNRRVVEESIEAVRKAGLFKVCTPKRYGGWEMNPRHARREFGGRRGRRRHRLGR